MGILNVFTGPMKCGKSNRIIEEARRQKLTGKKVTVFKPRLDDRFSSHHVVNRDGNKIFAINIETLEDLIEYQYNTDVFIIDEFQFLKGDISIICDLIDHNKIFYIAGLNMTTDRKPFGLMPIILAMADNITVMNAVCEECHNDNAIYSYCKIPKTEDILVRR